MGKKKSSRRGGSSRGGPDRENQAPARLVSAVSDTAAISDFAAARASVGRGSLAGQVLSSLELAIDELQRAHREVAALGTSLALARDQLVEQEHELELLRDSASA